MALSDARIRSIKPDSKPLKIFDEKGLFLVVSPPGGKWWRFKYRYDGKEKLLSLGTYPDVPLSEARDKRDEARRLLRSGVDPSAARKAHKAARADQAGNSFEAIAREWFGKHSPRWKLSHSEKINRRLERDVFPWMGKRPVAEIKAPDVLSVLRRIEHRGTLETAHRAMQNCSQVFRYAVATGRAERDPTADLRGALPPAKEKHHASITEPSRIGELLRAVAGYRGAFATRCALRLAALLFVRPGELRRAEWEEFNLDAAEWRIPAAKMKMGTQHIVPLSQQALQVLHELQPLTGDGRFLFPGVRSANRPMSENTVNAALRRLGFTKDEMTGHGFRSMASTLLNETGWSRDAIERQLAHGERDAVRAAYNYAEHLEERRRMMQAWADMLAQIETGKSKVVPIRRRENAANR